jgi:hypothetical protein
MCRNTYKVVKAALDSQANMNDWAQPKISWVEQYTVLYIGKSNVSRAKAQKELGQWYTIGREMVPEVETPPSPCK